jgi:hypothetical protein
MTPAKFDRIFSSLVISLESVAMACPTMSRSNGSRVQERPNCCLAHGGKRVLTHDDTEVVDQDGHRRI